MICYVILYKCFNTEHVMRWRQILEYFGPELKYIKVEKNIVADALSSLEMIDNQEILKISELYGYDDAAVPDSAYPIRYHDISKAQKNDTKLNQKIVSHKDYTLDTFRGDDQNHCLIFQNRKICLPAELQKKTVDWYHEILCHPGDTLTDHTLRKCFEWKDPCTTVHGVCKKCPKFQRAKTTNQKYGKLPPK